MPIWVILIAVLVPVFAVFLFLLVVIFRCCRTSKGDEQFVETTRIRNGDRESLQSGIARLHHGYENSYKNAASVHNNEIETKRRSNYYVLKRELSAKPYFNWADHPSLVSEAVEHGWSRFAFSGHNMSSPSTRTMLLALCVSGDQVRESAAEISWEISLGSAEFMQKVRLNSGLKKASIESTPPLGVSCATQTGLPLPGPFLGNSSFPQEAYFEITVLSSRDGDVRKVRDRKGEGEKIKLIQEVVDVNSQNDELKISFKEEDPSEAMAVSVGLSVGGSHPRRLPGSYFGSVGFNSDGSVNLDGIKLVFGSEKADWGSIDRVIGCGFDPALKKVFFTVDSELTHVVQCKSDEFSRPLYPTLAANIDVTLLVNLGQSPFKYAPANVHRTPNPCFIGSLGNGHAAALGYEDSKELFSMGRIDSEWLDRSTTKSSQSTVNAGSRKVDVDEESEADLFEIVLDSRNRSPSTFL